MKECTFCQIVKGESDAVKVYEDDEFVAFMDNRPINKGHTLIVPKKHYDLIFEMSEEDVCKLFSLCLRIAKALMRAVKADGLNIGQNNGRAAGQIIDHVHVHLIPRFFGDSNKGWPTRKNSRKKELEEIARKIEEELEVVSN